MNCVRAQELLVDLLYEELDAEEQASVTAHLEACTNCQRHWSRVRAISSAADGWSAPPVSRGIAERALARVAAEQRAAWTRTSWSAEAVFGRVLLAAAAALASLLLVTGVAGRQTTALGMGVLAVIWTVLYSGLLVSGHHPWVRGLTLTALTGAGVTLVLVPVLAIPSVVEACTRWVGAAHTAAPWTLVLLVVAAGYTAAPLLVSALGARAEHDHHWVTDGLKLSLLYALLIAPAVYLQCVALPREVTALWMAGALVGTGAAGPVGLRLGDWLRRPA